MVSGLYSCLSSSLWVSASVSLLQQKRRLSQQRTQIFISTFVYKELTLKSFYHIVLNAGRSTAMVMFLVGCAMVAAWLITVAQLPQQLAEMLGPLVDSPRLLMAVIMLLVLCVGMVMDLSPTILILVPLLMPVIKNGWNRPYLLRPVVRYQLFNWSDYASSRHRTERSVWCSSSANVDCCERRTTLHCCIHGPTHTVCHLP